MKYYRLDLTDVEKKELQEYRAIIVKRDNRRFYVGLRQPNKSTKVNVREVINKEITLEFTKVGNDSGIPDTIEIED